MNWWRRLLKREQLERELEAEIQFHLDQQVRENVRRGMSEEEAHRAARMAIGGPEQLKEDCPDARGTRWLEDIVQDLRFAVRLLAKDRTFTVAAIVTLALGIGANTAMFSVIQSVLLAPLPYRHPERVLWIAQNNVTTDNELAIVFGSDLEAWRNQSTSFDGLSVLLAGDATMDGDEPAQVRVACVSDTLSRIFGVQPELGRDFLPDEFEHAPQAPGLRASSETRNSTGVAILTERLFRRLGSDPGILGEPVVIGRTSYTVVGVLPSAFRLPVAPSLQLGIGPQTDTDVVLNTTVDSMYRGPGAVLARLKPEVSIGTAIAELEGIREAANLSRSDSERSSGLRLQVNPLHDHVVAGSRQVLLVAWASVGFVWLVACVNIVSLLLARSVARHQETAIRTALGAGRWRLVRQMIAENMMLAITGGLAGIGLGYLVVRVLTQTSAVDLPRLQDATLNWTVLMFSAAVCGVSGVILGLFPAQSTPVHPGSELKPGGRTQSSAGRVLRWHSALVVCEVALALLPLMGAGLMLRSLWEVRSEGAVLSPHQVLTGRIQTGSSQGDPAAPPGLHESDELIARIESLPGVTAAALWSMTFGYPARVAGAAQPEEETVAMWLNVSPRFGEASGLRVVAGRWFAERDRTASPAVVVVSEGFARRFATDPAELDSIVGRATFGPFAPPDSPERDAPMTIIGVVSDFRSGGSGVLQPDDVNPLPQVFFPDVLRPMVGGELLVRTSADPLSFVGPIRRIVEGRPPTRLVAARRLDDQLTAALAPRRFHTGLMVGFAGIALLLAMVGTYGVVSYAVSQRTHEIGVRMALGARHADILRMVLTRGATLVLAGLAVGVAGSASLTRTISSLLYGVTATDIWTYAAVSALLVAVSLVAVSVPARRAVRVNPIEALRDE